MDEAKGAAKGHRLLVLPCRVDIFEELTESKSVALTDIHCTVLQYQEFTLEELLNELLI